MRLWSSSWAQPHKRSGFHGGTDGRVDGCGKEADVNGINGRTGGAGDGMEWGGME